MSPLISAPELLARLGEANLRIVDCRHDLLDLEAGRRAYQSTHIPGALFLHLDEDLSAAKTGKNGRHPLPTPKLLAQRLGAAGIGDGHHVVAYDASGGAYAARLWWSLRWLGHRNVQVLDGGLPAWIAAGGAQDALLPRQAPATLSVRAQDGWLVDAGAVQANLDQQAFVLIDARAPGRYAGEGEVIDPVAGHIPGALNRFFQLNLQADGRFKSPEVLRSEWLALLDGSDARDSVAQCGSGVTACHNLLAMELAGLPGARLYAGSWSEWCSDPARPVATGAAAG